MAFPSNDFDGQEPDDIDTICANMKEKYNVNFEIFDKVRLTLSRERVKVKAVFYLDHNGGTPLQVSFESNQD